MKTYLEVPFSEKDEAKNLGARWDAQERKWYVPEHLHADAFSRWLTHAEESSQILVAPIWLMRSEENCWKCGHLSAVFCIASQGVVDIEDGGPYRVENSGVIFISDLESIDVRIEPLLKTHATRYRPDFSKTQGMRLWMNHCEKCGIKMGDFFMHQEPGGAFFPTTPSEEARLSPTLLFERGRFKFSGSFGMRS